MEINGVLFHSLYIYLKLSRHFTCSVCIGTGFNREKNNLGTNTLIISILAFPLQTAHCLNIPPLCLSNTLCVCALPLEAPRHTSVCCLHYWKV